ncbi:DUF4238 domain-containing protein [Variovorax sp. RB2P76]|uniref:DUF4238 domain-containing protein n=1 Tax=Variovorax sp. RB2P76 TaxID=3443736 RepID=UPI003F48D2A9
MSNDHYVPQHFLRAWACDPEKNKIRAYQRIEQTGKVVASLTKPRSIVTSASQSDLYQISDGVQTAEFETSIMTRDVDTPMSNVLLKLRSFGLGSLNQEDMLLLCRYVVILEGRNPAVMKQMQLSTTDVGDIFAGIEKSGSFSKGAIADLRKLTEQMFAVSGAAATGAYAGFGHLPDAAALLQMKCIEITRDDAKGYLTSNYPVGRVNDFRDPGCLVTLAVSPTQGLVFANETICQKLSSSPTDEQWRLIDLQTLSKASYAFTIFSKMDPFVERHLGWDLHREVARQEYFSCAMQRPYT